MDHSICLYNTMISSNQSHTWDQGPLYLSMQHHGLFSPIPYMRPMTTLSVYTTSSLLINPIHENRDHSICLYNTMVSSYQSHTWEQGALYLSIQHHGLFSPILFMRSGTTLCLYNTMVSSHQFYSWDQEPLYLSIQHHGLFSPITYMRPGTTLSVYPTPWSLLIYIYALVHLPICPLWIADNLLLVFWCLPDIRKTGTWFIKVILTQIETFFERVLWMQKQKYLPHINYTCTYILSLI